VRKKYEKTKKAWMTFFKDKWELHESAEGMHTKELAIDTETTELEPAGDIDATVAAKESASDIEAKESASGIEHTVAAKKPASGSDGPNLAIKSVGDWSKDDIDGDDWLCNMRDKMSSPSAEEILPDPLADVECVSVYSDESELGDDIDKLEVGHTYGWYEGHVLRHLRLEDGTMIWEIEFAVSYTAVADGVEAIFVDGEKTAMTSDETMTNNSTPMKAFQKCSRQRLERLRSEAPRRGQDPRQR